MLTSRQMADCLHDAGLRPGDSVMLHISFKSLGSVEGGPVAVIEAFLDVLSPAGTLLAPTLIFNGSQHVFLAGYPSNVDLRTTPSCTGVLSETLRTRPGAVRSIHATHPVAAVGARATELSGRHHLDDTAVGPNSPWALNAASDNGWIVLLGVTHASNTTLHHLEELYTDWLLPPLATQVTFLDTAGQRRTARLRPYTPHLPRDYPKIEPLLLADGLQHNIPLGHTTVRLIRAAAMLERIGREVRRNQYYLLKDPAARPPALTPVARCTGDR